MKVGLRLDSQLVINMTHIIDVCKFGNLFHIALVNGFVHIVIRKSEVEPPLIGDVESNYVVVEENEFHRIQRELSEYLGVELN